MDVGFNINAAVVLPPKAGLLSWRPLPLIPYNFTSVERVGIKLERDFWLILIANYFDERMEDLVGADACVALNDLGIRFASRMLFERMVP